MTMVELVDEDGARERVEAAGVDEPAADLDEFRRAAERLLLDAGSAGRTGREAAALLIAETLRLGARYGIHSASCVDGRVVVAATAMGATPAAPSASFAPTARRSRPTWEPDAVAHDVPVTEFGKVPGPHLARLADGVAFSISRRARVVVEVHPLSDAQARAAGLYDDPAVAVDPVAVSQLMDNPSGVLKRIEAEPDRLALLRKNNVVIGCIVPAGHPVLVAALGPAPARL